MTETLEIAPFRSVNDFLTGANYQIPEFSDLKRVNSRMVNNLIYYQTNYFAILLIFFILSGLWKPNEVVVGLLAVLIAIGVICAVYKYKVHLSRFQRQHPIASLIIVLAIAYASTYYFASAAVFLLSLLIPIAICLTHSMIRTRNFMNKFTNLKDRTVSLASSPMGVILDALGQDTRSILKDIKNTAQ